MEALRQDASLLPCTVKNPKGKLWVRVQSKILSLPKLNTFLGQSKLARLYYIFINNPDSIDKVLKKYIQFKKNCTIHLPHIDKTVHEFNSASLYCSSCRCRTSTENPVTKRLNEFKIALCTVLARIAYWVSSVVLTNCIAGVGGVTHCNRYLLDVLHCLCSERF